MKKTFRRGPEIIYSSKSNQLRFFIKYFARLCKFLKQIIKPTKPVFTESQQTIDFRTVAIFTFKFSFSFFF